MARLFVVGKDASAAEIGCDTLMDAGLTIKGLKMSLKIY